MGKLWIHSNRPDADSRLIAQSLSLKDACQRLVALAQSTRHTDKRIARHLSQFIIMEDR